MQNRVHKNVHPVLCNTLIFNYLAPRLLLYGYLGNVAPEGGVVGGAVLLGHVELPVSLGAPEEGSVAKTLVDGVKDLGEVLVTLLRICIGPDGGRCTLCGDDLCEHNAGLLVAKTRPEEAPCRLYGRCNDGTVVGRSVRENRVQAAACLGEVLLEAVGHGKHGHFRCQF